MASDKMEKKRKRASDRHERPSKKPALDLQTLPPLAASMIKDNSELAPVLITTPGVTSQPNVRLNAYLKDRRHVSSHSTGNTGIAETELLLQSSEHPNLEFVGREANDDSDAKLKHYVAVVDPANKTWQFVEVRKVTLRGAVRQLAPAEEEEEEEESEDEAMQSMRAQRTELTNTFGTKKSRKATQSMAENAQLSNAPAGAATAAESAILSSMPVGASTDMASKIAAVQAEVQAAKPVPTANLDANHPSEVYPIETLVPNGKATLRQLPIQEWQDAAAAGQPIQTTSRYVSNRVDAVASSGNTTQLQILRFILVLLEFSRCLRKAGNSSQSAGPGSKRLPPRDDLRRALSSASKQPSTGEATESSGEQIPDPVIDAIRRKFAPGGTFLSKHDITFLHITICALSLHIPPQASIEGDAANYGGNAPNELATDIGDLRDDLHLDPAGITSHYRELGCRVDKPRESEFAKWGIKNKATATASRIAKLKIPLIFPKFSRGGRR